MLHLLLRLLFPAATRPTTGATVFRTLLVVFLAAWSVRYFVISVQDLGEDPGWMHRVHLVFHEAGHAITAMVTDRREIVVFMGSGFQVLFPLFVAAAFYWKNSDAVGAALGLWWAGHAALDVAPYVADARALQLELLSGGTGAEVEGHDWEYLLTVWHALPQDVIIAERIALGGRVAMAVALLWAAAAIIAERFLLAPERNESGSTTV